jgi:hypothetical protein
MLHKSTETVKTLTYFYLGVHQMCHFDIFICWVSRRTLQKCEIVIKRGTIVLHASQSSIQDDPQNMVPSDKIKYCLAQY